MKKLIAVLLSAAALFSLCACGANSNANADGSSTVTPEYILKMGTHLNVGSIGDTTCNEFASLVSEKTSGRVKVDVFPGAQMGQELDEAESVTLGTLDLTFVSTTAYNDAVPGFAVDCLPFLFESVDEFNYIFCETDVGKTLEENLLEKGGRILSWIPSGFRQMYFADTEVTSYTQVEGMKFRAPESSLYVDMLRAMGANPISVTWGETYSAMQTSLADACECPFLSMTDANMQDVVNYGLITNHMILCYLMVINEELFQSLPEDIQAAILEAGQEAGANASRRALELDEASRQTMEKAGVIFHDLSESEADELQALMTPVREDWIGSDPVRREIVDAILAGKANYES